MNETLNAAAWSLMYIPNWVLITMAIVGMVAIGAITYAAYRFVRGHVQKLA